MLNSNTTAAEVFSDFLECCETFILSFETLLVVIIITPDQYFTVSVSVVAVNYDN